jgi:hypothetical protein
MDLHFSSTKSTDKVNQMVLNTRTMMDVMCFSHMTVDRNVYCDFFGFDREDVTYITELDEDVAYWNKVTGNPKQKKGERLCS